MIDLKTAATRAADWLEANRDKHIAGKLAVDDDGNNVKFTDPTATCFCALGRLGKELDLPQEFAASYEPFMAVFADAPISWSRIYDANDRHAGPVFDEVIVAPTLGGVEILRELAASL